MTLAVVASLSLSSIAFELLLTRYFSVAHWSHLSFLAISIAMFGVAAGGTFHCLAAGRWRREAERDSRALFSLLSLLGAVATIGAFLLVKTIPLDYLRFPVDGMQIPWLLFSYLLLSLPFFVSGLASCTAFALEPGKSGAISCAAMLGSGAGALLPLLLIPLLGDGGAVAAAALVPLLPPLAARGRGRVRAAALAIALALCGFTVWQRAGMLSIDPSPYKTLPQLLQAPGTRVTGRSDSILGRVEEVESQLIRFAPGLSLGYTGALPSQRALVEDGDAMSVLYDITGPDSAAFARWTHPFAAFVLAGRDAPERALVLQRDGGLAFTCAAAAGARLVTLVVQDPRIARRLRSHYRMPGVSVAAEGARSYLAGHGGRFDAILVESWGPSLPGMASLSEDALLTVDAFRACWQRLDDRGVLAVSRRLILPPSDSVRLFATALQSLGQLGVPEPAGHLAVIRGWDTFTLLVSRAPIRGEALDRLRGFAETSSFDLDYYPGIDASGSNRFNKYDRPYFTEAYLGLIADPLFAGRYFLDVAPQPDDRPFPAHFLKWGRLGDFRRASGGRVYTLLLTGDVVAGVTLLEATAVGLALVGATVLLARRKSRRAAVFPRIPWRGSSAFLLLAAAVGVGFLFAEIFIVDSLTPIFASPSVALAIALGGLLVSSGIGGLLSERLSARSLRAVLALIAVSLVVLSFLLPWLFRLLLPLDAPLRVVASLVLAAVPGFLIGIPFPAAMRLIATGDEERASAWAVNGCASVVATVSSALIAPAAGIRCLLLLAAAAYAVAAVGALLAQRSRATN